jgi:hypothetical protein
VYPEESAAFKDKHRPRRILFDSKKTVCDDPLEIRDFVLNGPTGFMADCGLNHGQLQAAPS